MAIAGKVPVAVDPHEQFLMTCATPSVPELRRDGRREGAAEEQDQRCCHRSDLERDAASGISRPQPHLIQPLFLAAGLRIGTGSRNAAVDVGPTVVGIIAVAADEGVVALPTE